MSFRRAAAVLRLATLVPMAWALAVVFAAPTSAVDGLDGISSTGPLTRIIVTPELNCQVAHREDASFELFPGSDEVGACGTFLAVDGTLYGPSVVPSGVSPDAAWVPVSQSGATGSGTGTDPFRIVTVVDAPTAGLRIEQADTYVTGSQAYTTEIRITNIGAAPHTGTLYRAADCYLQESDTGFGRVDGGAPACVTALGEGARIEQWLPITPGSSYMEGGYSDVWAVVASQQPFPNTCACDVEVDNGAGLSWPVSAAPGETVTIIHQTYFSPLGRAGLAEPFRQSVPGPTEISLDPIVVAQTVAVAAGVILLVPFPSALFNSTLEENYEEVMRGVDRVRGSFAAIAAGALGWTRRHVAEQRGRAGSAPGGAQPGGAERGDSRAASPGGTAAPAEDASTPVAWPSTEAVQVAPPAAAEAVVERDGGTAAQVQRATPVPPDLWRTPQGIAVFVAASAVLYAFLDPTFGLSLDSLATLGGLVLGLLVVVLAQGIPMAVFARRRRFPIVARALPATLLVGVVCVLVSRFANFQPGYVYGLIVGFLIADGADGAEEGRAKAIATAVVLGCALGAWILLAVMRSDGLTPDLLSAMVQTAAVTVVVAGVEAAAFAMLPLRFLPGAAVFGWDRRVWAALLGLGVAGFVHILLNPTTGYLADDTRTSFLTLVVFLVGFAIGTVLFWAYFRFRPARVAQP